MAKPTQAINSPTTKQPAKAPPAQQTGGPTLGGELLASKIGLAQGNGHLQQVMAFVKQTEGKTATPDAPYQPHSTMADPATSGNGLSATNGHGHHSPQADEADLEEAPAAEELA